MLADLIDLQERVAFAMWKQEAVSAAPNVAKNRTLDGFGDELDETRKRWLGLAGAAIQEITYPTANKG